MSVIRSAFDALRVTFDNLLRKPNTVMHPFVPRVRSARYRQTFALLHEANGDEACIGCKKCEKICPSEVITVVAGGKRESPNTGKKRGWCDDFDLDLTACIVCELCVQVCPVDAIVMCRVPNEPGFAREDLLLTMKRLYDNESLARSPYTGTSLVASHEPAQAAKAGASPTPGEAPKA
jgi:NADH-quinone oxidoreductase subunit I